MPPNTAIKPTKYGSIAFLEVRLTFLPLPRPRRYDLIRELNLLDFDL